MSRLLVVDYGVGNLHSVVNAFRFIGVEAELSADPRVVASSDRIVVPGVGAFPDGMEKLRQRGLDDAVRTVVHEGRPVLGICLGMQLLFSESTEFGTHAGLDIIPGRVVGIAPEPGIKVPHIGWNRVVPSPSRTWEGTGLRDFEPGAAAYFVHSFFAQPADPSDRLADAFYGSTVVAAAVQRENVFGCQFHPEKSGPAGLRILRTFVEN